MGSWKYQMPQPDPDKCRRFAARCQEMAHDFRGNPELEKKLIEMAAQWLVEAELMEEMS